MPVHDDRMPRATSIQEVKKTKLGKISVMFRFISLFFMVSNIVSDVNVSVKYYNDGDIIWFRLTLVFVIVPSILMQIMSCLLYYIKSSYPQKYFSVFLHVLQLGVVERILLSVYYGVKSRIDRNRETMKLFLENARDTAFIRLIESAMESGPQLILQLYILLTYEKQVTFKEDYRTIISLFFSFTSLAQSLVTFSKKLRSSEPDPTTHDYRTHTICGAFFQFLYRFCIISSRVLVLTLFATKFKLWVLLVVAIHVIVMVIGLCVVKTTFFEDANIGKRMKILLEMFFRVILGFIYVFCFLTPVNGRTRKIASWYYVLMLVENTLLFSLWITHHDGHSDVLEYVAVGIIWGGYVLGIILLCVYYTYFHPKNDITEECQTKLVARMKKMCSCDNEELNETSSILPDSITT